MSGHLDLLTYQDLVDHCVDYFGADVTAEADRYARRAIQAAMKEMGSNHRWSYFYQHGHLATVGSYNTGTIEYLQSSGALPRQLTLTGGTWPAWAAFGVVTLGSVVQPPTILPLGGIVNYEVDQRVSDTVLTLRAADNPGFDIAAGGNFTLYRDSYPLPIDFIAADELVNMGYVQALSYVHPREWLGDQRLIRGPAVPRVYTFMGDPKYQGTMCVKLYPPPDNVYELDYVYQRRPRELRIANYSAGAVSVASGDTAVTGVGTAWTSYMIGSLIRFSADLNVPTGLTGANPAATTRVVIDVPSATSITVDSPLTSAFGGVGYSISDVVDIEPGAMQTYLLRECERQARLVRRLKETPQEGQAYVMAMKLAWEADSRNFGRRAAGTGSKFTRRLAWMPRGPDA
jgi:hypothetical protein